MKINISKDSQYRSQLDNTFYPRSTCNSTASVNALLACGIPFTLPDSARGMQPEDYLTLLLSDDAAWAYMRKNFPWAISGGYEPREVHGMIEWAINQRLVGRSVDRFTTKASMAEILWRIVRLGCAVNMSGAFTASGHIVTVVGLETDQEDIDQVEEPEEIELSLVNAIVIDDPYGDYFSGYRKANGNNIVFPYHVFNQITKTYNNDQSKWAHLFNKDGWL